MAECTCITCKKALYILEGSLKEAKEEIKELRDQIRATDSLIEMLRQGKLH